MIKDRSTIIASRFQNIQDSICNALESVEIKANFNETIWQRSKNEADGGGRSRVIVNGNLLEKGGVLFSGVGGVLPESMVKALNVNDNQFFATGVSIVLHPTSPRQPIIHMNIRYFELADGTYWFGGGIDLTPIYVNTEQAVFFHNALKDVCDKYNKDMYPDFKAWADTYFYNKHRSEARGIGGIFFDKLNHKSKYNLTFEQVWAFVQDVGMAFADTYLWILQQNLNIEPTEDHYLWQAVRRGRYVEFNLVYDKGTKFGLETDGRTESILVSMPPMAKWVYEHQTLPESEEAKTLYYLKNIQNWVAVPTVAKNYN